MFKGWIALDIDGTITWSREEVPSEVVSLLFQLQNEGWKIAMVTGRPFAFAQRALSSFTFPYAFFAQNGSLGLEMPEKKILFKSYIPLSHLSIVEEAFEGMSGDFLIYAGYERGDFCYFRADRFQEKELSYLEDVQRRQKESWRIVRNFDEIDLDSTPLIKCFGKEIEMSRLQNRLEKTHLFELTKIRDPFSQETTLLLITDRTASKGNALKRLWTFQARGPLVIAAGDDENDKSLLEEADVKIAMAHAPESLQKMADYIAPPTEEKGIIAALNWAVTQ